MTDRTLPRRARGALTLAALAAFLLAGAMLRHDAPVQVAQRAIAERPAAC